MARMLGHHYEFDGQYAPADFRPATYITQSVEKDNAPKLQDQPEAFSAAAAWFTFKAMQQVERPNSEGNWQHFESSRRIAWKTGTSFGFRDAWAVGVNPRYAVGVWAGNADGEGRPGLIGILAAAPVLFDIFNQLPGDDEWFEPPYDDMLQLELCRTSGYRAGKHCTPDTAWVPAGGTRVKACDFHQITHLDASRQWRVNAFCEQPDGMIAQAFFVLPPVEEHYYRKRHPDYRPVPPLRIDCRSGEPPEDMQLIYPKNISQIYVPVGLDGELSKTVFKVAHRRPGVAIHWHLDERYIGTTREFHSMELVPPVGAHVLTLVDERGARLEQGFEIIGK